MDAALLFRRLADVIERRRQPLPGPNGGGSLAQGADAGDGIRPPGAIARIWHRLKARASQRSDAGPAATQPQPCTLAVRVKLAGDLPSIIGQRDLLVTLPQGATVGDLLDSLSRTYGDAFTCWAFRSPGKLRHTMLILVDGVNIKLRGGLAAKLGDSEVEVIMLPIIAGG